MVSVSTVKTRRKIWLAAGIVLFMAYFFCAARPIPLETVLIPRWLTSLETGKPVPLVEDPAMTGGSDAWDSGSLIPFKLGSRFGYFDYEGRFSVNQVKKGNISLSGDRWAEYDAEPERITVNSSGGETLGFIDNPRGYPFFLDGRTFLIGSEQNAISEIDGSGSLIWTYEFSSPLTCVDSAAGLLLAGSLDGVAGVLDSGGKQIFSFEPGGSRYSIILGCAISRDGSRLALISGIDEQRFLLLERFGTNDYKVIYHEFLDGDFRRPVYVSFIEEDRWIVFECSGGLGFFDVGSRQAGKVELQGNLSAIDHSGGQGLLFAIVSSPLNDKAKELVGIRLPGRVIIEAPLKSEDVFLGRHDSRLFVGGKQTLVSFDLEKR